MRTDPWTKLNSKITMPPKTMPPKKPTKAPVKGAPVKKPAAKVAAPGNSWLLPFGSSLEFTWFTLA